MKTLGRRMAMGLRAQARKAALGLERLLPRPTVTGGAFPRRPITRVVVFGRLPNPTIDYYLLARLRAAGMPPARIVDIREVDLGTIEPVGTLVIICRYATRRLVTWIERHSAVLAGVALFTDDDIGAVITGSEAKLGYRLFLYHRALGPLRRLNRHLDMVWASTPALAEALSEAKAQVLPPAPPEELWQGSTEATVVDGSGAVSIVYHATAVHTKEHRFLRPIIEAVLRARPEVEFEVTADERTAPIWATLERVRVVPPSSWEAFLARTTQQGADIALVPLLRSRANETRAGTKRIDVVRLGAAGIFSESSAYGAPDGSAEPRLPNRRKVWIETILRLVDDPQARADAAAASRRLVVASSLAAGLGLPGLEAREAAGD